MSAHSKVRRMTAPGIRARKGGADPIVCLTAYTTPVAELLDPHVDLLLVGDSVGMVFYGMPSTLGVTLDMMIAHGAAVMRGSKTACVVVDMPFGSYEESPEFAFRSAARILAETGCNAVKIEGGHEMADTVSFMVERGVPVMGHVGLRPQAANVLGGFKVQGRRREEWEAIIDDAKAIDSAGAFSIVIEAVPGQLAGEITAAVDSPTIGIGASAACDGQVLVTDDMLGMSEWSPKFVKRYVELGPQIADAAKLYAEAVKDRSFPDEEHSYVMKD